MDENVFEIEQGVAVFLGRRSRVGTSKAAHARIEGSREEKYEQLAEVGRKFLFETLNPRSPSYSFNPNSGGSLAIEDEYAAGTAIAELLSVNSGAIITSRDGLLIDFESNRLLAKVNKFADTKSDDTAILDELDFSIKKGWNVERGKNSVRQARSEGRQAGKVRQIAYRPFDVRFIYYDTKLIDTPSAPVSQLMYELENLALLTPRIKNLDKFTHVFVSSVPGEKKVATHDRATQMFALYLRDGQINIDRNLADMFGRAVDLAYDASNTSVEQHSFGPRDLFDWIYAVLHAPSYRTRFAEFLKSDFPRIPTPGSRDLFAKLVALGHELVALHLLKADEAPILKATTITFHGSGEARVAKGYPEYVNGKVMINANRWFEDVPRATWEFHVGGYQVLEKWLKDRAEKGGKTPKPGRVLTDEDILHYRRIVVSLTETRRLMAEIDKTIETHGGWPGAFGGGHGKAQ